MLTIHVPLSENFDETTQEFIVEVFKLELEHSLAALSKWESKLEKPFFGREEKTTEEVLLYIKCMTLTPDVPPEVFQKLSEANYQAINNYLESKQTATWFSDKRPQTQSGEVITAEIIYYWMTISQIPWEAQYWHLNRLFTLIRVFDLKHAKPKPMGRAEQMQRQREENARRRAQLGSKG